MTEAEQEVRMAKPQLTRGQERQVLGTPWDRAGNQLHPKGINNLVFTCLQHSVATDKYKGVQTQAGGRNSRTTAVQAA